MFWLWAAATAAIRENSPERRETVANMYEVTRTQELMRHVSRRERCAVITPPHAAGAPPCQQSGRSASDSVTHKTQLKQNTKTHRCTTQLAVGVDNTAAHGRFVRWQFLIQISSAHNSGALRPIKQCSICRPTSGRRLTTNTGRSKQLRLQGSPALGRPPSGLPASLFLPSQNSLTGNRTSLKQLPGQKQLLLLTGFPFFLWIKSNDRSLFWAIKKKLVQFYCSSFSLESLYILFAP